MKTQIAIATAALLAGIVSAQATDNPGQEMQSESAPGASEYSTPNADSDLTPGHEMQEETGPGASNYTGDETDVDGPGKSANAPGQDKGLDWGKHMSVE